jgi:hypothetical protein
MYGIVSMTNKQTFYEIRKIGMAVSYNNGEWRIDYKKDDVRKTTESSYFTEDKDDAIATARVMFGWHK